MNCEYRMRSVPALLYEIIGLVFSSFWKKCKINFVSVPRLSDIFVIRLIRARFRILFHFKFIQISDNNFGSTIIVYQSSSLFILLVMI